MEVQGYRQEQILMLPVANAVVLPYKGCAARLVDDSNQEEISQS